MESQIVVFKMTDGRFSEECQITLPAHMQECLVIFLHSVFHQNTDYFIHLLKGMITGLSHGGHFMKLYIYQHCCWNSNKRHVTISLQHSNALEQDNKPQRLLQF